ncbi:MAG: family 43 glycosylhydrolase [Lachnospiraceae bacterium]
MQKLQKTIACLLVVVMVFMISIPESIMLCKAEEESELQVSLNAIEIKNSDNIKGNITLPEEIDGTPLEWTSSNSDIIDVNPDNGLAPGIVNRPENGTGDASVVLTVTANSGTESASRDIPCVVRELPKEEEYEGYLFAYFTGGLESIYLAVSEDGLNWTEINRKRPVFTSTLGTKGLRDPYIIRSNEGDKYYILATDLKIANTSWGDAMQRGSKSIIIYESDDLVTWSEPRMVQVAFDTAGSAWAPEAAYNEETGEYVVFWSSNTSEDNFAKYRVYYATTRDFYTFSDPVLYTEIDNTSKIDLSVIKAQDKYFRFSSIAANTDAYPEYPNGHILMESSDTLLGEWSDVSSSSLDGQSSSHAVEGPECFKFNGEDKWCVLVDYYGGSGYYPLITNDLSSAEFEIPESYDMPDGARHGAVIPLTKTEYDNVVAGYPNQSVIYDDTEKIIPSEIFGSANGQWETSSPYSNAFDGDSTTYFDGQSNGYLGIDAGETCKLKAVKVMAREEYTTRMSGVMIQASNDKEEWKTLATITESDYLDNPDYMEIPVETNRQYRYYRLCAPVSGNCNIAEVEFYRVKALPETIIDLDFESGLNEEGYYNGGNGIAKPESTVTIEEVIVNGIASNGMSVNSADKGCLELFKNDGSSLLAGKDEITVSYWENNEDSSTSWAFFSHADASAPTYKYEKYFGIISKNTQVTVEKYNNSGSRLAEGTADITGLDAGWRHIAVVLTSEGADVYLNGEYQENYVAETTPLSTILGDSPVSYIGKSTWGGGEYSTLKMDEFKIYDGALSASQISLAMDDIDGEIVYDPALEENFNAAVDTIASKMLADNTSLSSVSSNLNLMTALDLEEGDAAIHVTWKSSDTSVISTTGVVTTPDIHSKVRLTATVSYQDFEVTKTFLATVVPVWPEVGSIQKIDIKQLIADGQVTLIDSYNSNGYEKRTAAQTKDNVLAISDGDEATFSDFRYTNTDGTLSPNGGYIIFDFDATQEKRIHSASILARADQVARINGALIQGSNDLNGDWVDLTAKAVNTAEWQNLSVQNEDKYRYIRLYNANNWYGNLAELELYEVVNASEEQPYVTNVKGDDVNILFTDVDAESRTITLYINRYEDITEVPLTFEFKNVETASTPANGTTVDLSNEKEYVFKLGENELIYTIKTVICNNSIFDGKYADPDIAYFNGKYYIYPTTDGYSGWSGTQFHVFSSENLVDWEDHGVILDVATDDVPWAVGSAWAPCIAEKNGTYYFYFCAKLPNGKSCIGVATAPSPTGPFTAEETPLLTVDMCTAAGISMGQTIDPSVVIDEGTPYILFGNGKPAIAELNEDMLSIKSETLQNYEGATDFREAITVTKRDGVYHFTWSCDDTGSENYHVNYGTSDSIFGPITYQYTLLKKDTSKGILGTGHHSIVKLPDQDKYIIAYHRFVMPGDDISSGQKGYNRETCIDYLEFDENGMMKVVTPTLTGIQTEMDVYKILNAATGLVSLTEAEKAAADRNNDNCITAIDALLFVQNELEGEE